MPSSERERREMQQSDRLVRADEDKVLGMLRTLFAVQSHYTLRELQEKTSQPKQHLQSILDKFCMYHEKGEYKNMYSLRDISTVML